MINQERIFNVNFNKARKTAAEFPPKYASEAKAAKAFIEDYTNNNLASVDLSDRRITKHYLMFALGAYALNFHQFPSHNPHYMSYKKAWNKPEGIVVKPTQLFKRTTPKTELIDAFEIKYQNKVKTSIDTESSCFFI